MSAEQVYGFGYEEIGNDGAGADTGVAGLPEFEYTPEPVLLNAEQEIHLAMLMEAGKLAAGQLAAADAGELCVSEVRRTELECQQAAGLRARGWMIRCNMGLVITLVNRFSKCGIPTEDLEQYAVGAVTGPQGPIETGLIRAVDKFDYTKGYKFSTYAVPWIRNALQYASALHGSPIRVSRTVHDNILVMVSAKDELRLEHGRNPDINIIADYLGKRPSEIQELERLHKLYWMRGAVDSWDRIVEAHTANDSGGGAIGNIVPDNSYNPDSQERTDNLALCEALGRIPARQQIVVTMAHGMGADGKPHTLTNIANALGHDEVTGKKLKAADVRLILDEAMAGLQGIFSDVIIDDDDNASAKIRPPAERLPSPDEMSFNDLIRDSRFAIATERLVLVCSQSQRRLIANTYPHIRADELGPLLSRMPQSDKIPDLWTQLDDTLRAIIDGRYDYSQPGRNNHLAGHVLLFMGTTGLPVPLGIDLDGLRSVCNRRLDQTAELSGYTRELIRHYYGLGSDRIITPRKLARKVSLSPGCLSAIVDDGIRTFIRAIARQRLAATG